MHKCAISSISTLVAQLSNFIIALLFISETTDPTLTPPTDVEGFCSHAIWRIPSGIPCGDIDKFEVRLYNPTTGGEELREASADGTFYSLPSSESDDELYLHEDTQFQVSLDIYSGTSDKRQSVLRKQ